MIVYSEEAVQKVTGYKIFFGFNLTAAADRPLNPPHGTPSRPFWRGGL
ncbi:hypothetical protein [Runella zeae]|nr:hypothetical protein [Runella zeae]